MKNYAVIAALLMISVMGNAMTIQKTIGWIETAAVEWLPVDGAVSYTVKYTGEGIMDCVVDCELIRSYPGYMRADIPGLKQGVYTVTITADDINGEVLETVMTDNISVVPMVREGFAFKDGFVPGAYNLDGTPKDGAQIIYITADNVNTVELDVIGEKGKAIRTAGLMNILNARNKGYDKTPLIIRMIGCINAENINGLKSNNYIAFIGANTDKRMTENITIEGIGNDATAYGYGFFTKRSRGIEIRNLGIMLFGDDGVSMEADNSHIWVHNCDFFYGSPGSDKDQVKGDGSIDMKYNTTNITICHNHFWDSGKTSFAGGATESSPIYFTYHHNWFDHADSRCPRLCHATAHIYNNYFDANPTMCLLSTENSSAFVEANYYRACPSPMEINMQGTNRRRWPDGTQNGGMNKGFNNIYTGTYELITQKDNASDFDVFVVENRDDKVPETVKSLKGGNIYSNFDTADDMYEYHPDAPENVSELVMRYAGRMEGGDFKWNFTSSDDTSTSINMALRNAILDYSCKLLGTGNATGIHNAAGNTTSEITGIYDIRGMKVMNVNDIDQLPKGMYVVRKPNCVVKRIVTK